MKEKAKMRIVRPPSLFKMLDYPDIQPKITIEVPSEESFYMTSIWDSEKKEERVESFGGTCQEVMDWHHFNVKEINREYNLKNQNDDDGTVPNSCGKYCRFEDLISGDKGFFSEPERAMEWSDLWEDEEEYEDED